MAESVFCETILGKRLVAKDLLVLCENRVYAGANAFVRYGGALVELGKTVYA